MDFNNGKSKNIVKIIIGLFFALLILFGIFSLFIKPRLNKKEPVDINLADYVIVKTSGTNGSGKISPSLNKTAFVIDYEGQIYEEDSKKPIKARNFIESLDKNITYAISKENNLKKGQSHRAGKLRDRTASPLISNPVFFPSNYTASTKIQ